MNFAKLDPLYVLCKQIIKKEVSVGMAVEKMEKILCAPDPFPEWVIVAMYHISAFTSAILFFHGGWKDAGMSALLACVPAGLRIAANRWGYLWWTYELLSCTLISLFATLLHTHFCYSSVLLSSIVSLLPGYTITSALTELLTRNIVSGAVRLAYVVAYLSFMALGATISPIIVSGIRGQGFLRQPPEVAGVCGAEQTIQVHHAWVVLMVSLYVVSYNYYLQIPYRRWPSTFYTALGGYAAGFLTKRVLHAPPELNALSAALAIGLLANLHSRFTDRLSTHAIVAGVFVQVPGSWGMRGILEFAYGNVERGVYWTYEMLVICVAIAGAM
ncbi:hypothetical protein HDV00_004904 [Rhizophlyctis rosea]|nr:hypothetical protein HDV00_004904 [Rhizophlyctis rosea]